MFHHQHWHQHRHKHSSSSIIRISSIKNKYKKIDPTSLGQVCPRCWPQRGSGPACGWPPRSSAPWGSSSRTCACRWSRTCGHALMSKLSGGNVYASSRYQMQKYLLQEKVIMWKSLLVISINWICFNFIRLSHGNLKYVRMQISRWKS